MKIVKVNLGRRSYKIIISDHLIEKIGQFLKRLPIGRDVVVITNSRLSSLYKDILTRSLAKEGFTVRFELIPDTEKAKSEMIIRKTIGSISAFDKRRDISIAAFGGGVVGDVAGFIAAIYKRGIPYVQVPTTLLAQVDSAIGGKVAIDLAAAKNLVGAFYQSRLVLSDVSILKTLPKRQIISGLAETIKYGVIADPELFEYLEERLHDILNLTEATLKFVVFRCSLIKARIVEKDEFDTKGIRMMLNYGHTIGHAIESASSYSRRYTHGEAVAIGMVVANKIAVRIGLLKESVAHRIGDLIERSGLPTRIEGLSLKKIYESHLHDKKFSGRTNRFVLPLRIGKAKVVSGVKGSIVKRALEETRVNK